MPARYVARTPYARRGVRRAASATLFYAAAMFTRYLTAFIDID